MHSNGEQQRKKLEAIFKMIPVGVKVENVNFNGMIEDIERLIESSHSHLIEEVEKLKIKLKHKSKTFPEHTKQYKEYWASDCAACDKSEEVETHNKAIDKVLTLLQARKD